MQRLVYLLWSGVESWPWVEQSFDVHGVTKKKLCFSVFHVA